jgi:hypothetical protein
MPLHRTLEGEAGKEVLTGEAFRAAAPRSGRDGEWCAVKGKPSGSVLQLQGDRDMRKRLDTQSAMRTTTGSSSPSMADGGRVMRW